MSTSRVLTSDGVAHTIDLGKKLGRSAQPNDVIALTGPLGAGKTQLAKGIAAGLEVADTRIVNSPTFTIVNEYDGRLHMYHVDAYRLQGAAELAALGFDEMCSSGGVVVLEWAEKALTILPPDHLLVAMTVTSDCSRELVFSADGPASNQLLSSLAGKQNETSPRPQRP